MTNATRTDEERPDSNVGTAPREIFPSIPKWHKDKKKLEERFALVLAGVSPKSLYKVYLIQEAGSQSIKIGIAQNVVRRMTSLQTAHPMPLRLLGQCDGGLKLEQALHAEFAADQLLGEWFKPSDRLTARIFELCAR